MAACELCEIGGCDRPGGCADRRPETGPAPLGLFFLALAALHLAGADLSAALVFGAVGLLTLRAGG